MGFERANARNLLYSTPERLDRYHAITYKLAAMVTLAGSVPDFQCRRVHGPSGVRKEPRYKPDGVVLLPLGMVMRVEVEGKMLCDLGITDIIVAFLIETKGMSARQQDATHATIGKWAET